MKKLIHHEKPLKKKISDALVHTEGPSIRSIIIKGGKKTYDPKTTWDEGQDGK